LFTFECPECESKSEYDSLLEDVKSTQVIVCPSCQALYDVVDTDSSNGTIHTTKSKFDKTNYRNKIRGIENQLDMLGKRGLETKHNYTVSCPHCQHPWEFKGVPIKSVHWCSSCYQYFGIDDVKTTISTTSNKTFDFKTDFQVSAIYPSSIMNYNIHKLANFWVTGNNPKLKIEGQLLT